MKISRVLFLMVVVMLFLCLPVISHSGRTDSNGGHRNSSTGEYHYHHGHSAHQHSDLDGDGVKDCPFDFDDKTAQSSGSRSASSSSLTNNPQSFDYLYSSHDLTEHNLSEVPDNNLSILDTILMYLFMIAGFAFTLWFCYILIKIQSKNQRRRRWY